ncbi:MAG: VWA domain-containing protein, partial [Ignavibacteria bacterium]
MTFLNPAILLGLLAASVPIIIHLFNRRKLEIVEFSTLKFLKELQKTKIKRIKLKQIILLILRVLIIVFLVFAFARPAIKSINSSYGSSSSKSTGVLILDDSPSMAIIEGRGSKFSKAKHLMKSIMNFYQDGDDIIIYYASEPDRNYKFNTPEQAINFFSKKSVSEKPANLLECLKKASDILKRSSNINKEIFLLSDLQKDNLNSVDSISAYFNSEGINFYITDFENSQKVNYSLNSISINNRIFELNKEISINVAAKGNTGDRVLSLFINKSRAAQKRIEFENGNRISEDFTVTLKETGLLQIHASLEEDDFDYDNSFYEAISIPEIINVGLIYNDIEEITFIKSALEVEEGKSIKTTTI